MTGELAEIPGRTDWRVALRAYVSGHDRGEVAEAKLSDALSATGGGHPAREGTTEPSEREALEGPTAAGERSTYGVPIPDHLSFHRSAGTWRERIPWVRIRGRDRGTDERGA